MKAEGRKECPGTGGDRGGACDNFKISKMSANLERGVKKIIPSRDYKKNPVFRFRRSLFFAQISRAPIVSRVALKGKRFLVLAYSSTFLAIFRNEITTILTPSTAEGVIGGGGDGHVFRVGGP